MVKKYSGPARSALTAALVAAALGAAGTASAERVVVEFKAGKVAAARAAIANAGGRVLLDLSEDNALAADLSANAIVALRRNPAVASVEADPLRYAMGTKNRAQNGAVRAAASGSEVIPYGIDMVQSAAVGFNPAGGRKVCVIDSGFDIKHEDLQHGNVDGQNLTTSGEWYTDEDAHGTHVTGTIAALGGNGLGVVGVIPGGQLNIYVAKVFDATGSARSSVIMRGVRACARAGANVVNMSLGGGEPTNFEARTYQRFYDAGMLVIASSGNGGNDILNYPAAYPSVVSVAAVDANRVRAGFSTFNADVELAAPGVNVLSTVPTGSNLESIVTVGGSAYDTAPMGGSPLTSAGGALHDFGTGEVDDPNVAGKVCLIRRGNISFADKVLRCQNNGGVAAIVYNNASGMLYGTLGATATTIPSVGTSDLSGAAMLSQVGQTANVAVQVSAYDYAEFSGTSMAAPHVTGVAALVWSNFPSCSNARIREALIASATDLGISGRDDAYGFGLVQAKAAFDWLTVNGCTAR